MGGGFAAAPREDGPAGLRVGLEEAVEPGMLRASDERGQPAPRRVLGLLAGCGNEACQLREPRADHSLSAELVTGQLE